MSGNIQLWSGELWIPVSLCERCFPVAAGWFLKLFFWCCCWWCWCFFVVVFLRQRFTLKMLEGFKKKKKATLQLTLTDRGKMCKKNEKNSKIWQLNYAALPFARLSAEVPGEKVIDSSCSLHQRWLQREEALRLKAGLAFFALVFWGTFW